MRPPLRDMLVGRGWTVPEAEICGERVAVADGLNEVRFHSEADRSAAQILAIQAAALNPAGEPV